MLIIAPIIFFILYFFINNYAIKLGLYDKNEFKKNRNNYISLTGGIYIFFSLILVSTFILPYDKLYFITLSSFGIFLMGLIDDLKNISFRSRFLFQIAFVLIFVILSQLYIINFGFFNIDHRFIFFSIIFTTFAIVGLINAFNFIDGIDGLSSSLFLIAIFFIKIFVIIKEGYYFYDQLDILILLLLCFLIINKKFFNFNQIFLGDSGSMFLGFLISIYLIYFSNILNVISPTVVYWFVAIPVFDFFSVIAIRIYNKKNPMVGDNYHFHHLLINNGYTNNHVLIIMIFLAFLFSLIGIFIDIYLHSILNLIIFTSFILFSIILRIILHKNY